MSKRVPLYRHYSPSQGDHFYCKSKEESDNAVSVYGYTFEGIECYVFPDAEEEAAPEPRPTMRDQFAFAVIGHLAGSWRGGTGQATKLAADAYVYADALLKAREKK